MAFVASLQTTWPVCGHLQQRPRCSHPVLPSLSSSFKGLSLAQRQPAARQQRSCTPTFARQAGGGSEGRGDDRRGGNQEPDDGFEERVVQVRRVTKVVKGGKQLSFRAVVVVGDGKGTVGVGCASAKEIAQAVQRAVLVAKRESVSFPLNKAYSLPHRIDGYWGAAKVMLRPAADGAGVIAGGAVRVVLELAGVRNCFGKQLGSANPLNNARATIEGLAALRTFKQVSQERGISVQELMGINAEPQVQPSAGLAAAAAGAL